MNNKLYPSIAAGSRKSHGPHLVKIILDEILHDNSTFAKGYQQYIASQGKGGTVFKASTDLSCSQIHDVTGTLPWIV